MTAREQLLRRRNSGNQRVARDAAAEIRTGKTTLELQIARARAEIAGYEIELCRAAPGDKQRWRDAIARWQTHLEQLETANA